MRERIASFGKDLHKICSKVLKLEPVVLIIFKKTWIAGRKEVMRLLLRETVETEGRFPRKPKTFSESWQLSRTSVCKLDILEILQQPGLHKLWHPSIRDTSTWIMFGAHGEHGAVFLFSNLGAL